MCPPPPPRPGVDKEQHGDGGTRGRSTAPRSLNSSPTGPTSSVAGSRSLSPAHSARRSAASSDARLPAADAASAPPDRAGLAAAPDHDDEPTLAHDHFLAQIYLAPYGVLGYDDQGPVASEPNAETAFVDPAGLHHIQQQGPCQAG
eukprot:5012565-Alexandrium_andersonii.AAC.1